MPLAFLICKKETNRLICLTVCLFFFSLQTPAQAFLKKEKVSKNSPATDVAVDFSYRVFFIIEPSVKDPESKKYWTEINYKLVDGKEVPGPLFPEAPGGKVRFLDKDGFMLASDYFLNEDFQKTDFYGTLTVEKKRAAAIVSADAKPLREGELEALKRERAEREEQKRREEELFQKAIGTEPSPEPEQKEELPSPPVGEVLPSPSVSVTQEIPAEQQVQPAPPSSPEPSVPAVPAALPHEPQSPAPQASAAPAVEPSVPPEQKQVTAPSTHVKIPPSSPDKKEELLDLGGTTNDDIQETLLERSKQPATEVKESPSEIPGISADNEQPGIVE